MQAETRRQELETFVANSRAVRRKVVWAGAIGLALAFATSSLAVALVAVVIAGAGTWITTAHIQDFEKELRGLRRHRPATLQG